MTQAMERRGADAPQVHRPQRANQPWPVEFWSSAIGKKWVMAVTGLGLMGFVFAHMVGNLKMFLGAEEFDAYAESLKTLLYPIVPENGVLWAFRVGLIVMFGLHILSAYQLTRMNHRARPVKYQSPRDYIAANFAARTMRWSGIIIGLYLIFHLGDLTWGWFVPEFVKADAYNNLVTSLSRPPVAAVYIVANIALGIHLFHGGWSMFQTLGLNSPRYNGARRAFAATFAVVVAGMNVFFPIAVLTGIVSN